MYPGSGETPLSPPLPSLALLLPPILALMRRRTSPLLPVFVCFFFRRSLRLPRERLRGLELEPGQRRGQGAGGRRGVGPVQRADAGHDHEEHAQGTYVCVCDMHYVGRLTWLFLLYYCQVQSRTPCTATGPLC